MAGRREQPRPAPYFPLPPGLPDARQAARTVFDRIAGLYDAARPGYPASAIDELVERCGIDRTAAVLEVGCGTGQLTRSLAPLGFRIRALEPGTALAGRARAVLAGFPNVELATSTFEDAEERPSCYDLVVSATAFHWIDPSISFAKAARLLRPAGHLALLTNAHGAGGSQKRISVAVRDLHRRLAPEVGTWEFPAVEELEHAARGGGDIAAVWHRVERKFETPPVVDALFADPSVSVHPWTATYDRQGYLAMLGSQSSYALMDEARRTRLLGEIGELVDRDLGGIVTKQYVTVLAVAERR